MCSTATAWSPLSGNATGTAKTRYVHPDHLGSTNVVTDENDNVVQTLDYYYDPVRGQFISEDPVFWEIGLTDDGKSTLLNSQVQNSYAYANDNPIVGEDPTGRCFGPFIEFLPACVGAAGGVTETLIENPDATPARILVGAAGGFAQGLVAEGRAVYAAGVGLIGFGSSLIQDRIGGKQLDFLKAFGNAAGAVGGKTASMSTVAIGDAILTRLGIQPVKSGAAEVVQSLLNAGTESGYSSYASQILLPGITAGGGVTTFQAANGTGFQIAGGGNGSSQASGSSGGGFSSGGYTFTPGLLPRTTNPVGNNSSGAPVYCLGYCGK
jgi:RHS repeat-associated protein